MTDVRMTIVFSYDAEDSRLATSGIAREVLQMLNDSDEDWPIDQFRCTGLEEMEPAVWRALKLDDVNHGAVARAADKKVTRRG